jgi:hypothetical protein
MHTFNPLMPKKLGMDAHTQLATSYQIIETSQIGLVSAINCLERKPNNLDKNCSL